MITRVNPYLVLDGTSQEAIRFYEQVLDAKVLHMQKFGDMPPNPEYPLPEEAKDRVSHALIQVGVGELMFSDTFPGQPSTKGDMISICIETDNAEESKRIFSALQDGGTVTMPIQETFWSPAYGIVTDKFGVQFQITTEMNRER